MAEATGERFTLVHLPVVSPEAVEAAKAFFAQRTPQPEDVHTALEGLGRDNPQLRDWLLRVTDAPLDALFEGWEEDEWGCSARQFLRDTFLWGLVRTLDLLDRELFRDRMARLLR